MRATIKAVFPDRDAFTLLRPMLKEEDLNRLDAIPYSKLRPEFQKVGGGLTGVRPAFERPLTGFPQAPRAGAGSRCAPTSPSHPTPSPFRPTQPQGMDEFLGLLRSKAHPLQFSGQLVTGRAYAQLAEAYVTALNQGAVPQLVTAWQVEGRGERACAGGRGLGKGSGGAGRSRTRRPHQPAAWAPPRPPETTCPAPHRRLAPSLLAVPLTTPSHPSHPPSPNPQGVARAECQKAYDAALGAFNSAFKEEGADEEALLERYQAGGGACGPGALEARAGARGRGKSGERGPARRGTPAYAAPGPGPAPR
jgi:hypothetical protein